MRTYASAPGAGSTGRAVALIRLMVGGVFLAEGVLKFLYPEEFAAGRFAKIGIPLPSVLGPFVGGVEVFCGLTIVVLYMLSGLEEASS